MKHDEDFIAQLEDYLVEFDGVTPLPDRVRDAIHVELPRTRQAQARPGLMRMQPMLSTISSRAPLGWQLRRSSSQWLSAQCSSIAAATRRVSGWPRLASPSLGRAPARPRHQPHPLQTCRMHRRSRAEASASPECLKPGTYGLGSTTLWPAVVSLEVPASWWYYEEGTGYAGVLVDRHRDVPNGSGWGDHASTRSARCPSTLATRQPACTTRCRHAWRVGGGDGELAGLRGDRAGTDQERGLRRRELDAHVHEDHRRLPIGGHLDDAELVPHGGLSVGE